MKDDFQCSTSAASIITLESEVAEWPKYGNTKPCPTCSTVVEHPGAIVVSDKLEDDDATNLDCGVRLESGGMSELSNPLLLALWLFGSRTTDAWLLIPFLGCGPGDFVEIREDTPLGVVLWMRALHYVQVVVLYPISVVLAIAFMAFMSICIIGGLGEYTLKAFFRIVIEAMAAPLLLFLFLVWCLVLPLFMVVAWLLQCYQRRKSVQSHQEGSYYEHKLASM